MKPHMNYLEIHKAIIDMIEQIGLPFKFTIAINLDPGKRELNVTLKELLHTNTAVAVLVTAGFFVDWAGALPSVTSDGEKYYAFDVGGITQVILQTLAITPSLNPEYVIMKHENRSVFLNLFPDAYIADEMSPPFADDVLREGGVIPVNKPTEPLTHDPDGTHQCYVCAQGRKCCPTHDSKAIFNREQYAHLGAAFGEFPGLETIIRASSGMPIGDALDSQAHLRELLVMSPQYCLSVLENFPESDIAEALLAAMNEAAEEDPPGAVFFDPKKAMRYLKTYAKHKEDPHAPIGDPDPDCEDCHGAGNCGTCQDMSPVWRDS